MSGFDAVSGNVTMNAYSAFDMTSSGSSIIGCIAVIVFLGCVVLMPKHIRRLLVGYVLLAVAAFVCLILYVLLKSIEPIGNFLFYDVCRWIGDFIIGYWVYILISLPLAYLVGVGSEKYLFEEDIKKKKVRRDG